MKLISFSVANYRSIKSANKLKFGELTTLVGPNNEGKSNILRALVISLEFLRSARTERLYRGRLSYVRSGVERFSWELDFPLSLQEKKPDGASRFDLEFQLDESELAEFQAEVKSKLNGSLPIRVEIGPKDVEFTVRKPGKGAAALTKKREQIVRFLSKRLNLTYIPSVRTAREAERIVDQLLGAALSQLDLDPKYRAALTAVRSIEAPVLNALSKNITNTLSTFIPGVKEVRLELSDGNRPQALTIDKRILVDDGTPTTLDRKGDGIQSLAALALMKYLSESSPGKHHHILAIEEPESHLHPNAIHELKRVLGEISESNQVIITTHNPLLVNRSQISSNILVQDSSAKPASNTEEIRNALGVRASDNLRHAELLLLVEGEDDRRSLGAIFKGLSKPIAKALADGSFAIETLNGGSNLCYKLSEARAALCNTHVFLDRDVCGVDAAKRAEDEGLLEPADLHFAICSGQSETELEDLLAKDLYGKMLLNKYGVSIAHPKFKGKKKWSDRLKLTFEAQGKLWSDSIEEEVKYRVAALVEANPSKAIEPSFQAIIDSLSQAIQEKLTVIVKSRDTP
jgi:putative ATP-dependent endonuclease of OLD family